MSEPVRVNPNIHQLIVDLDGVSEATALREIADHLESLGDECVLHSVTLHSGSPRFNETSDVLCALIEDMTLTSDKARGA